MLLFLYQFSDYTQKAVLIYIHMQLAMKVAPPNQLIYFKFKNPTEQRGRCER